jgi:flagella basal body P-ring formation protein FlgA
MLRAVLVLVLAAGSLPPTPLLADEMLVATRTLRAMTEIVPGDVAVVAGDHPGALRSPEEAVGLEARVVIYAGRPILPSDLGPAATVERNGIVPLLFRRGGLTILAEGRSLGRGGPGDTIRVMNLSSRSTVSGRIGPDGVVHVAGSLHPALP